MIRYIYSDALGNFPKLRDTMFRDRADQFKTRLGWDVSVNTSGQERDDYDDLNPLYVIWQRPDGSHGGSMRFLPTTGPTMVNDHFTHLSDGVTVQSQAIWECTRFCLARDADAKISAALMLGGVEVGLGFHLSDAIGVFDARMKRIYRRLGWSPTILGQEGTGRDAVCVGLWEISRDIREKLIRRAGLSADISTLWFDRAFGKPDRVRIAA